MNSITDNYMQTELYKPVVTAGSLIILENGQIKRYALDRKTQWTMGRLSPNNYPDIPLRSSIASRMHGYFECMNGRWYYIYTGSKNSTFYNETILRTERIGSCTPQLLNNGDVIRIDYANLNTPDPRGVWILFTTDYVEDEWSTYSLLNKQSVFIGRNPEMCDFVLKDVPYISSKHAQIIYRDGAHYIGDCDSLSGTWVNGKRIKDPVQLKEKDKISLCDCHFIYSSGKLICNRRIYIRRRSDEARRIILKANIRSKKVINNSGKDRGMKEIVRNVHLEVREGSLVALLGSSGAGKTTVMNCLNGMDRTGVDGQVLFYNEDLYRNFERMKFFIGSVPQQNVVHPMLTVEEELREAAIIRLPADMTGREIQERVEDTLQALGLEAVRKSRIHKLSGGEQKRVNIGIELVADRCLLCLDEPDAGLDPETKKELFTLLRELAHKKKKSILVIIHDVTEIDLFDQVILMTKYNNVGCLAFSGSPKDARAYFGVENFRDVYGVVAQNPSKYVKDINYEGRR